jgi:uncharacterized protein
MNPHPLFLRLILAGACCSLLPGCLNLKPAANPARHFVLSSLPASERGAVSKSSASLGVGIGPVKIPSYLFNNSMAVRKGTNEIRYLEFALWAERLDIGLQRVLAANLSDLLPTDRIRLSAWRRDDVAVEVYVAIERFDVDETGRGVLVAWWRLTTPGGEKLLRSDASRLSRQGPPPTTDPQGAAATLSELAADLSRTLTEALKATALPGATGK